MGEEISPHLCLHDTAEGHRRNWRHSASGEWSAEDGEGFCSWSTLLKLCNMLSNTQHMHIYYLTLNSKRGNTNTPSAPELTPTASPPALLAVLRGPAGLSPGNARCTAGTQSLAPALGL